MTPAEINEELARAQRLRRMAAELVVEARAIESRYPHPKRPERRSMQQVLVDGGLVARPQRSRRRS